MHKYQKLKIHFSYQKIAISEMSQNCVDLPLSSDKTVQKGRMECWNCNCKYDKLYSTVAGKPLLGCFTRTFTVSAISNFVITDQVQFQLFFESRKGFGCPNSCRKAVPSTWTSDLKGPIAHFSLGSWHENIS